MFPVMLLMFTVDVTEQKIVNKVPRKRHYEVNLCLKCTRIFCVFAIPVYAVLTVGDLLHIFVTSRWRL